MIPRPLVFCLLVVPLLAVLLSGCIGGDDEVRPFADGGAEVTVRSVYDQDLRPQGDKADAADASVDLPSGTPATQQVFQLILRPIAGVDYLGWEGDEDCAPGYVNKASGERRKTDCSASDGKAVVVVPPPDVTKSATRYNYRFDDDGARVLVFPQPVDLAVRIMAIYSDELLEQRADPDGCHAFDSYAVGEHQDVAGDVRTEGPWLTVAGDGTIDIPFYGICNAG